MGIDGGVTLTKMLVRIPVEPSPEVLKFSVNCLSCCYKFVSKTQQKYIKLTENHRKTSKLQERARPVSFATSHPHLFPWSESSLSKKVWQNGYKKWRLYFTRYRQKPGIQYLFYETCVCYGE